LLYLTTKHVFENFVGGKSRLRAWTRQIHSSTRDRQVFHNKGTFLSPKWPVSDTYKQSRSFAGNLLVV